MVTDDKTTMHCHCQCPTGNTVGPTTNKLSILVSSHQNDGKKSPTIDCNPPAFAFECEFRGMALSIACFWKKIDVHPPILAQHVTLGSMVFFLPNDNTTLSCCCNRDLWRQFVADETKFIFSLLTSRCLTMTNMHFSTMSM